MVADASGDARYVTMFAISAGSISRWISDCGRWRRMNSRWASSQPRSSPTRLCTNSSTPPVCVGPAMTELTVTPVPAAAFAKPRETASRAVFDMP